MRRNMQLPYIFIDRFFLNRIFLAISRGSAMTNHTTLRHWTGTAFFSQKKSILKIDKSVKIPWHRLSTVEPRLSGPRLCGLLDYPPGEVLPEKLGRGVRPASQNPYPIYDQNVQFSQPYLWPDRKLDTLFITWPFTVTINILICVGLLLLILFSMRSRCSTGERKTKRGWKEGDMIKK